MRVARAIDIMKIKNTVVCVLVGLGCFKLRYVVLFCTRLMLFIDCLVLIVLKNVTIIIREVKIIINFVCL